VEGRGWSSRRRKGYSDWRRVPDLLAGKTTRESRSETPSGFAASVHYEKGKRQAVVSVINAFSQCDEITFHNATFSLARGTSQ
jgi:hypothetical protein